MSDTNKQQKDPQLISTQCNHRALKSCCSSNIY